MRKVYICPICGNIVTLEHDGKGKLVCCGTEMRVLEPNTKDAAIEKHVPVFIKHENNGEKILVSVGENIHPMDDDHYIEWIRMENEYETLTTYLKPGDDPKAVFPYVKGSTLYAYCNKHGLWKSEVE